MKCPKCGYLGFDASDRCRNCGYDFSLIAQAAPAAFAARRPPTEQPGGTSTPDPRFARGSRYRRSGLEGGGADRTLAETLEGAPVDLPLFGGDVPILPPPRAPLSVRRPTPAPARVRPRTPTPQPDAAMLLAGASEEGPAPLATPAATAAGTRSDKPQWHPAAPRERAAAAAIDVGILLLIDLVVLQFTLSLCGLTFAELEVLPALPMTAFLLVLNGGYVVLFTGTLGQTIGKMATAIEVVPERRDRMDLRRAALRGAAMVVSLLPAGLGWLVGLVGDQRGLHDRLAGTRVVRVAGA